MVRLGNRSAWLFSALVAVSTVGPSTALAEGTSPWFESEIEEARQSIKTYPAAGIDTFNAFFRTALVGRDGIPGADLTGRREGAIMHYLGDAGPAACTGRLDNDARGGIIVNTGCVWGEIYQEWAAAGYEQGKGFPNGLEFPSSQGGEPGRRQVFVRFSARNLFEEYWVAFWNERTGIVTWRPSLFEE